VETPDFSALERQQRTTLEQRKRARDPRAVEAALAAIRAAAEREHSLMEPIIAAVRSRATLGEISDSLRSVWGVYRPT
jgi:methylmalonyl-CoA mutase N-terminal domain/subunit